MMNNENVPIKDSEFSAKEELEVKQQVLMSAVESGTPPVKAASRVSDHRLPAVKSTSVFDRLYKSHTIASKSHTEKDLLIFNRMSISRSKKMSTPHKISWESKGGRKLASPSPFTTPQPRKNGSAPSSWINHTGVPDSTPTKLSSSSPGITSTPTGSYKRSTTKRVYEFSPRMKPLTKLYFVSKFHPGLGPEPVDPISLGYTFFQTFCEYETGEIDPEEIAKEIFVAFFKKDFPCIRQWKLQEPSISTIDGRNECAYSIKMSATHVKGNTSKVTKARGVVRFKQNQKEIIVENFTY